VFCPGRRTHLVEVAQGLAVRVDQARLLVGHADALYNYTADATLQVRSA